LEHEGDVLQQEPARVAVSEQPEYLADQSRLVSLDARGASRLTEVLTRKASRAKTGVRQSDELTYVSYQRDPREALEEHSLSGLLDFTEKDGLVAGGVEAHLDTADTREQSDYRERS
jgi:hypothetical protein